MSTQALSYNLQPSRILEDFTKELRTGSVDDFILSPISDALSWMREIFGWQTQHYCEMLAPLDAAFSVPKTLKFAGETRNCYQKSDYNGVTKFAALTTVSGCKIPMFLDSLKLSVFTESLKSIKTVFWGALGLFDILNFRDTWNKLSELKKKKIDVMNAPLRGHKISFNYLKLLQSTATIGMASIMLVSLTYASIAHGFLFSPIVFLSLSSVWLILNYITFFYEKMIDQWKNDQPTWAPRLAGSKV